MKITVSKLLSGCGISVPSYCMAGIWRLLLKRTSIPSIEMSGRCSRRSLATDPSPQPTSRTFALAGIISPRWPASTSARRWKTNRSCSLPFMNLCVPLWSGSSMLEVQKADHERRQNGLESQRNQGSAWNHKPHCMGVIERTITHDSPLLDCKTQQHQTNDHRGGGD